MSKTILITGSSSSVGRIISLQECLPGSPHPSELLRALAPPLIRCGGLFLPADLYRFSCNRMGMAAEAPTSEDENRSCG